MKAIPKLSLSVTVALAAALGSTVCALPVLAEDPSREANAQLVTPVKTSPAMADDEIERAKKEALKKKEADARKQELERKAAEIDAAVDKRLAEIEKAEAQQKREEEARKQEEARRAEAAAKQAAEEAARQAAAEIAEARKQAAAARQAAKEAEYQAKLEAQKKADEEKRQELLAQRVSAVKKAPVEKKRSAKPKATLSEPVDHVALHKHYANWISYYAGGSIGRSSTDGEGGFTLGAFAGKNWQSDKIVYGVEAEISTLGGEGSDGGMFFEADWMAAVKGRVGYLVRPDTLLYATAGVAWANFDLQSGRSNYSETLTGFTIGAGVEHRFTEDWSARLEYAYTDFGSEKVGHDTFDPDIHAFKVSFVYRF